jgi:large subunit ribosomal protein L11
MAKKLIGSLKLQVPAGAANPSPPIGPALGQRGINIMEFCKAFNARTQQETKGTPLPVVIQYYQDKSFTFTIKTPPASHLIKQAVKVQGGSKLPGRESAGTITMAQCREIAKKKLSDMNSNDVEKAALTIAGSARSMGIQVTE